MSNQNKIIENHSNSLEILKEFAKKLKNEEKIIVFSKYPTSENNKDNKDIGNIEDIKNIGDNQDIEDNKDIKNIEDNKDIKNIKNI